MVSLVLQTSIQKKELFQQADQLLKAVDFRFLSQLYNLRCMSVDMAFRFFYSKIIPYLPYCTESLLQLSNLGLITIEQNDRAGSELLFLTTVGIQYLFHCADKENSNLVGDFWKQNSTWKTYESLAKTAPKLRIKDALINHQISLNYFVLEYEEYATRCGVKYTYMDSFLAPRCSDRLMPDGVLVFDDKIVLLEMDTGTERQQRLNKRWESYRAFFARPESFYENKHIVVLFILENVSASISRVNTFVKTVCSSGLISDISDRVELYAAKLDEAKRLLQSGLDSSYLNNELLVPSAKFLIQNCGFGFYSTEFLKNTGIPEFSYYICKKGGGANQPLVLDGRRVEFLMDVWGDGRFSVLHKIVYLDRIERLLKNTPGINREIPYIVVVPDPRVVASLLKNNAASNSKNLFFTTPARMEKDRPFYETIFSMDVEQHIRHFTDYSLTDTVYERKFDPTHPTAL